MATSNPTSTDWRSVPIADLIAGLPIRLRRRIRLDGERGCWLWTLKPDSDGYGRIHYRAPGAKTTKKAHRTVYEIIAGPIDAPTLDHLCRVRLCVNPFHLEPCGVKENLFRGVGLAVRNSAKTHCPEGHEYSRANTNVKRRPRSAYGARYSRRCLICKRRDDRDRARARRRTVAQAV